MAEVRLEHIAKAYDTKLGRAENRVIRNVSLAVRDQEFVVLVGPSGCGKSTLLRMIAGLESITEGALFIGDRRMNDVPASDRDIAMVFQNYALYPHMTVYDNMAFGLKLRGLPKDEIRQRVSKAARLLEIENLLDRKPKEMSGGQRQRVAIGRAIVRNPQVFLFDEPLSNLDAKLRGQMRIELQKLHRELNATMIYVTHDQIEAMTLGDRIVVLRNGDIMQFDTPLNLYNYPVNQFVAGFIGTPPMNFLPGRIAADGPLRFVSQTGSVTIPLAASTWTGPLSAYRGRAVVLGIRAEHLSAQPSDDHPAHRQRVTIEAAEHTGSELLAYFTLEDQRLVARLPASPSVTFGQEIDLFWNLSHCHFFDAQSEQAISSQPAVTDQAE